MSHIEEEEVEEEGGEKEEEEKEEEEEEEEEGVILLPRTVRPVLVAPRNKICPTVRSLQYMFESEETFQKL